MQTKGRGVLHVSPAVVLISCCDFSWYWHRPCLSKLFTADQNVSRMPRMCTCASWIVQFLYVCLFFSICDIRAGGRASLTHFETCKFLSAIFVVALSDDSEVVWTNLYDKTWGMGDREPVPNCPICQNCMPPSFSPLDVVMFFRQLCVAKEIMSNLMRLTLLETCNMNESWWREQEAVQSAVSFHKDRWQQCKLWDSFQCNVSLNSRNSTASQPSNMSASETSYFFFLITKTDCGPRYKFKLYEYSLMSCIFDDDRRMLQIAWC